MSSPQQRWPVERRPQRVEFSGKREAPTEPADFGSLDPEVSRDLAVLQEFAANRERHIAGLFGRTVRADPLRDKLLRVILLAFAEGKHMRVSHFVEECRSHGTPPSVRASINFLVEGGLVQLEPDPSHPRARLVRPTRKLVHFYNEQMPRLREEVARLLNLTIPRWPDERR
ncbi:MAG: hypothetical protein JOZ42_14805 [Acetobacteraceae bacterium]|nr:hypothetical protein [Acetobacteraceae bacterium]